VRVVGVEVTFSIEVVIQMENFMDTTPLLMPKISYNEVIYIINRRIGKC